MLDTTLIRKLVNEVPFYERNVKTTPFSKEVKLQIIKRDNETCKLCNVDKEVIVHHVIPHGPATIENGISLCYKCHMIVHIYLKMFKGYDSVPYWNEEYNSLSGELLFHLTAVSQEIENINKRVSVNDNKLSLLEKVLYETKMYKQLYEKEREHNEYYLAKIKKLTKNQRK